MAWSNLSPSGRFSRSLTNPGCLFFQGPPLTFSVVSFDSLRSFLRSSLRQSLSRYWTEVHSAEFDLQPTYLPFGLFISRV